ncbi:hypothetical protein [Streptomyces sp. NPDC000880]
MLTGRRTPKVAVTVAVALLLTACGSDDDDTKKKPKAPPAAKEDPRPGDQRVTITWKGQKSVYAVHAPPTYTPAKELPLVIARHPYPSDGAYAAKLTGLNAKADKEGFLVAYPDSLNQAYNALICHERRRLHAEVPGLRGHLHRRPRPEPQHHGNRHQHLARTACLQGRPSSEGQGQQHPHASEGRGQSEFLTYRLPDMGHNWPGNKDPGMGDPVTGVNATDLIWEFFKAHPRKSS